MNKAKLKRKQDREQWAATRKAVLALYNNNCVVCGKTDVPLDCHHLISRKDNFKYNADYIICLCKKCHKFAKYPNIGAHGNSLFFAIYFMQEYPDLWDKILDLYNKEVING